jgi:hypothetical protein
MTGVGDADRKISAGDFAASVARIYFFGSSRFLVGRFRVGFTILAGRM